MFHLFVAFRDLTATRDASLIFPSYALTVTCVPLLRCCRSYRAGPSRHWAINVILGIVIVSLSCQLSHRDADLRFFG